MYICVYIYNLYPNWLPNDIVLRSIHPRCVDTSPTRFLEPPVNCHLQRCDFTVLFFFGVAMCTVYHTDIQYVNTDIQYVYIYIYMYMYTYIYNYIYIHMIHMIHSQMAFMFSPSMGQKNLRRGPHFSTSDRYFGCPLKWMDGDARP